MSAHDNVRYYYNAVITAAQLQKPELSFCTGSNPVNGLSEIADGENL